MFRNVSSLFLRGKTTTLDPKFALGRVWYNTTFQSLINTTPHHAVYGRPPPPVISYGVKRTTNDNVKMQLMDRDITLATL